MTGGRGSRTQVLVALCAAGIALFNFPLLIVWDQPATVLGLPLLPVALFAIWAGLIAALAFANETGERHDEPKPGPKAGVEPRPEPGAESGLEVRRPEPGPEPAANRGGGAP